MSAEIRITALVENTAGHGLLGEHGLALWIETPAGAVLLDTGQGEVLLRNARALGTELPSAKAIILSHGHYDHTGGLPAAMSEARHARVFMHPAAIGPKFTRRPAGRLRNIGMPDTARKAVQQHAARVVWIERPTEVLPGLHATGPIPRVTEFEDTGGAFFLDADGLVPDTLVDDQAVWFDAPEGVVVLLGCAHAGVVNSVMYVRQLAGGRPIYAVVGGMHLLAASDIRMATTVAALREMDVQRVAMSHCTGFAAMARLYHELPGRCFHCTAGTRLEFRS